MKVGFLLDDHMHRPGGVQEYVLGLYHYLERQGYQAVIFSGGAQFDNPFAERIVQLGTAIPVKGSGSWTSIPLTLKSGRYLRQLLEAEGCDVLHVQAPYSPTLSGRLLAQSRAAHVVTFHIRIDDPWRLHLLSVLARFQRAAMRQFHAKIAISPAAQETADAFFPGGVYTTIGVGVDTAPFKAAFNMPRLPHYADGRVTLITVGRLEERKGVAHLLRAYALLEREHGTAIRLVIVGEGPEQERLQQLEHDLGLRTVTWLGYVSRTRLPHLLSSADIFCAPSLGHESFGKVLVEGMAAGLPIVAFANAGYSGVLSNHRGNFLVPIGDHRAMAGALGSFIASPSLRTHVSQQNRIDAEQYSWDVLGQQIVQVYQQALEVRQTQDPQAASQASH